MFKATLFSLLISLTLQAIFVLSQGFNLTGAPYMGDGPSQNAAAAPFSPVSPGASDSQFASKKIQDPNPASPDRSGSRMGRNDTDVSSAFGPAAPNPRVAADGPDGASAKKANPAIQPKDRRSAGGAGPSAPPPPLGF